jgi:N-acetylmuramoyl-L-alanine amidase
MPKVYLSPSNQMHNRCKWGDLEGQHAVQLSALISKKLLEKGIESKTRVPSHNLTTNMNEAKAFGADLYIPLHTNAAGSDARGTRFGYNSSRTDSKEACQIFVNRWKQFYPLPEKVKLATYNSFGEAKRPHCPSVYVELIFHSNIDDANFLHNNMEQCADVLVQCILDYFEFKGCGGVSDITVKFGSKGESVTKLQKFLVSIGYDILVDGKFGNQTLGALKDFQQKNGLESDGICGNITWEFINNYNSDNALYTVSISNLTKTSADFLLKTYSDAIVFKQ